jgi:hypothetical protein
MAVQRPSGASPIAAGAVAVGAGVGLGVGVGAGDGAADGDAGPTGDSVGGIEAGDVTWLELHPLITARIPSNATAVASFISFVAPRRVCRGGSSGGRQTGFRAIA